ncbi:MAG TPA: HDOD domain-containing protein [Dissulfurispiraceae bacterium]|nr:HDOD domain-containing protein [Dissulfurispiraceae bacterium]
MNESLRILTQKIPKLPTLPPVADKIINLVNSNAAFIGSIVETIEKDPAISAKIIGFSNAAFYRMGDPVTNIRDAVMKIGFDNVKSVALGISLLTLFKSERGEVPRDYRNIIRHSVVAGLMAKEVADMLKWRDHGEVFTCGLLHDLGLLVMSAYFPDIYSQVMTKFKEGAVFTEVEKEVCGFSHGEVGAWLADGWQLPESVCEVVRYHHTPAKAVLNPSITAVTHLADIIAVRGNYSPISAKGYESAPDKAAMRMVGMTEQNLGDWILRIEEIFGPMKDIWQ